MGPIWWTKRQVEQMRRQCGRFCFAWNSSSSSTSQQSPGGQSTASADRTYVFHRSIALSTGQAASNPFNEGDRVILSIE
eukprot:scaffold408661_cov48-Prasinocladus_malaysianus.AAC.1